MIHIKRAYEPSARGDGRRLLVECLWPRGMRKEALLLDAWVKDVAPSTELRKWFMSPGGPMVGISATLPARVECPP